MSILCMYTLLVGPCVPGPTYIHPPVGKEIGIITEPPKTVHTRSPSLDTAAGQSGHDLGSALPSFGGKASRLRAWPFHLLGSRRYRWYIQNARNCLSPQRPPNSHKPMAPENPLAGKCALTQYTGSQGPTKLASLGCHTYHRPSAAGISTPLRNQ